jgi:hypothetical protein
LLSPFFTTKRRKAHQRISRRRAIPDPGFLPFTAGRNRPPTRSSRDDGADDDGGCERSFLLAS